MRESFGLTSRLLWPALLGIGCVVHAQGPGSEMRLSLQRETKTPTRVANLRGGCSFIVNDLQGGSFEGPSYGRTDVAAVYFSDLRVGAGTTFNAPFFLHYRRRRRRLICCATRRKPVRPQARRQTNWW